MQKRKKLGLSKLYKGKGYLLPAKDALYHLKWNERIRADRKINLYNKDAIIEYALESNKPTIVGGKKLSLSILACVDLSKLRHIALLMGPRLRFEDCSKDVILQQLKTSKYNKDEHIFKEHEKILNDFWKWLENKGKGQAD